MEGAVDRGGMSVAIGCHRAAERHSNAPARPVVRGKEGVVRRSLKKLQNDNFR